MNKQDIISHSVEIVKDRQESPAGTDISYMEGVEDGLAFLLSTLFPDLDGATDVKELFVHGKKFNETQNVGNVKYLVTYHDGVKKHRDGSPFFDIATFSNKRKKDCFVRGLRLKGYVVG